MAMTSRTLNTNALNECSDGTICENAAPCLQHPTKEGAYMCDCFAAADPKNFLIKFAGPYCEHQATSYCSSSSSPTFHAFCTNGGECKRMVTKNEEHAGCKCRKGYEGDFCQFVEGSRPSDWELNNFMHPALSSAYGSNQDHTSFVLVALFIGALVTFVGICLFALLYVYIPSMKDRVYQIESDTTNTTSSDAARIASRAANVSFVAGKSVYQKKKTSVTADTMEADGGVLTAAMAAGGQPQSATMQEMQGLEDVDVEQKTSMEEVNLDDEPSSKLGEMA